METKSAEWIESREIKIKEAFEVFAKESGDAVVEEEIGTVMRSLGAFPTEKAISIDILPSLRDEDDAVTGVVQYKRFEKRMLQSLATKEYEPDTLDVLLQAFRTIDTNNTGYISYEILEDLLTNRGTAFRPRELESFFAVAKDPETGNVYYEDYVALLTKTIPSIY